MHQTTFRQHQVVSSPGENRWAFEGGDSYLFEFA